MSFAVRCLGLAFAGLVAQGCGTDEGPDVEPAPVPVLKAPQLRIPMSNAYVGSVHVPSSLAPTFRWEPSPDAAPASSYELQISADPQFARALLSIKTTNTQVVPANALPTSRVAPVGARYYWRVRACDGTGCSEFSSMRSLNLGRSEHDFNGDGFADVLVGAPTASYPQTAKVFVYFGGANAFDTSPAGTLTQVASGDGFGAALAAVGDVNGDGFADIAVGAPETNIDTGAAYVYFGGPGTTLDETADIVLQGPIPRGRFGASLSGAGDLDNDGFADLAIAAPGRDVVYVYRGPAARDPREQLSVLGASPLGIVVEAAGDLDADGYGDLVIGNRAGSVRVVWGGPRADSFASTSLSSKAIAVAGGRDVNGDGFADVLVGEYVSGAAALYFGGNDRETLDEHAARYAEADPGFGSSVALPGDVDGDGYDDVVIGATEDVLNGVGGAYFYTGGPSAEFSTIAFSAIVGTGGRHRWLLASSGDVNGDGFADVVVSPGDGAVSIYAGGNRALLETSAYVVLHKSPGEPGDYGGAVGVRAPDASSAAR